VATHHSVSAAAHGNKLVAVTICDRSPHSSQELSVWADVSKPSSNSSIRDQTGADTEGELGGAASKVMEGYNGVNRLIEAMGLLMDMHATLQVGLLLGCWEGFVGGLLRCWAGVHTESSLTNHVMPTHLPLGCAMQLAQ